MKRWFLVSFHFESDKKFKNIANIIKAELEFFSIQNLNRIVRA